MNGNAITVVGNLTRELDLSYSTGGQAYTRGAIAASRRWQDKGGKWQEETTFFDFTLFGDVAENAAESLGKGDRVIVTGRIQQETYERDGQKRTAMKLVVDEMGPSLRWARMKVSRVERQEPASAKANGGGGMTL